MCKCIFHYPLTPKQIKNKSKHETNKNKMNLHLHKCLHNKIDATEKNVRKIGLQLNQHSLAISFKNCFNKI